MFIFISLGDDLGGLQSFLYRVVLCAKFPWIMLASAGAGLGQLSVAFVEERFEHPGGRRSWGSEGSSWLSPTSHPWVLWLRGDGLCLILTLMLELLGASVDLMSARPVSSGSTGNSREQLRSGSSSCCVWPCKPPCCCNI